MNGNFKTKLAKLKLSYYGNYFINPNQILHNNKDHQMLFPVVQTHKKSKMVHIRHF